MVNLGLSESELKEVESAFPATPYTGKLLLMLAEQFRTYKETGRGAGNVFDAVTHLIAEVLGEDLLADLYGESPPEDAEPSEHMRALAWRLFPLSNLFVQDSLSDKSSISAAREELLAIAAGDAPRIFKAKEAVKGRPINAYRIASHQLRALAWEVFLKAQGNSVSDTHGAIHNAFGAEWSTIARWKAPVIRELGQQHYDRAMRDAERGFSPEIGLLRNTEEALTRLQRHGREYQEEQRQRVALT